MGKGEINNEIVLLRHAVRQARIRLVHKLSREIKLLRKRHGDGKQLEKFGRKADRLVEEILALKKAKDDDVSKFGLNNKRALPEILADVSVDASTRVLAKVTSNKILRDKIDAFKAKFPDYEKHLGPGKKKTKQLKRSNKNHVKTPMKNSESKDSTNHVDQVLTDSDDGDSLEDTQRDNNIKMDVEEVKESDKDCSTSNDLEPGSILRIKPSSTEPKSQQNSVKRKTEASSVKKKKEDGEKDLSKEEIVRSVKAVSKEATVKRFTDILQEEVVYDNEKSLQKEIETKENHSVESLEKEVDDFFMTADGNNAYLSISLPKNKSEENNLVETDADLSTAFRREKNLRKSDNRFFSKVEDPRDFPSKRNGKMNQQRYGKSGKNQATFEKNQTKNYSTKKNIKSTKDGEKANAETEKLHPSWAAKKQQQEIMKQGFQGKKIVFDDD